MNMAMPFFGVSVVPDSDTDAGDRQALLYLYAISGGSTPEPDPGSFHQVAHMPGVNRTRPI